MTRWGSHDSALRSYLRIKPVKLLVSDVRKVVAQHGELSFATEVPSAAPVAAASPSSVAAVPPKAAAPPLAAAKPKAVPKFKPKAKPKAHASTAKGPAAASIASGGSEQRRRIQNVDEYDEILR